jgi:lipopolysaccharide transport system permease protein
MMVGFTAIIIALILTRAIAWSILLLPVVWGLHVIALIGLNWILSLVNLVFRDLQNLIGIILLALMIVSPIAYTPEMVPPSLKIVLILNPFAYFVTAYQAVVILGQWPSWWNCIILVILSVGLFICGGYFFSRAKRVLIDYV